MLCIIYKAFRLQISINWWICLRESGILDHAKRREKNKLHGKTKEKVQHRKQGNNAQIPLMANLAGYYK